MPTGPSPETAAATLRKRIATAKLGAEARESGTVLSVGDGLARVSGLPGAALNEVLEFEGGIRGFVLSLEEDGLHAAFLDPGEGIVAGSTVARGGEILSVPVGDGFLGRVVDPLGRPLDDMLPPEPKGRLHAERPAPAIVERDFVAEPMETGLLVVDAMFAIGHGQRELIIGERQTGKTSVAVDAIITQSLLGTVCIYVAIGQRMSAVRRVIEAVRTHGRMENTAFVVAEPSSEPGLRWLAPFSATSLAEAFRDGGRKVLIVYDDLTKHAATHRELALLARQPPGREAYPGDIFFLHARLLERSGKLAAAKGGGSITALPIAEIDAGNLSAYIPTNLISIADGQIVTSAALFAANQRPAVDVGLSVSRVGGKAQPGAMKAVAGRLRLDYAQYLEMKMFSRFGGFGDKAAAARLVRGERIAGLLSQHRFSPVPVAAQVALLAALDAGLLDKVAHEALETAKADVAASVAADPALAALRDGARSLDDDLRAAVVAAVRTALGQP